MRQAAGVGLFLHKGAGADLDVQQQRVHALGQLLAHDGGGNQRDAFDGAGGVTEGVNLAVGRDQLLGLPDHGAAGAAHCFLELLDGEFGVEAGNGFQLVQRSAGVPQAAARDHGHRMAGGGHQRRQHQAGLVAHAAGRVLIDLGGRQVAEIDAGARLHVKFGEVGQLGIRQRLETDRHQKGGHLVIGHFAAGVALDHHGQFFAAQFCPVTLFTDDVDDSHVSLSAALALSRTSEQAGLDSRGLDV